jgi:ubiquinone/menaquinone biosynthesis C-methylase UbiE
MTDFDYEASIWGEGTATIAWSDPTSFRLRRSFEAVAALPSGATVLEVGAGAGQFIRAIKKQFPLLDCHGSDISREALERARTAGDGVVYDLNTPERLPYDDASIDAVLILDVVEHVTSPAELLSEVRRVLKPRGILYCFVPCEGDSLSIWNLLDHLGLKKNLTRRFAGHINYFSRATLAKLFADSGFERTRVVYSEHFFGQLLGILAFHLMARAAKRTGTEQLNNETYFQAQGTTATFLSRGIRLLKKMINSGVYLESALLQHLPSPNVHSFLRKQ